MYLIPTSLSASVEGTSQLIPRVIYQTFKSSEVTDRLYYAAQTWIQYNPDYSYEFYDDIRRDEYVKSYNCEGLSFTNEELNKAYNDVKPQASKADIWRYLILYEKGGVYTDMDTMCKVPLSEYINSDDTVVTGIVGKCTDGEINRNFHFIEDRNFFITWWHLFSQMFMVYTPKNPFVKTALEICIESINTRTPVPGSESCPNLVERYTGPCVLDYAVRQLLGLSKNEDLEVQYDTVLSLENLNQKIHLININEKINEKYNGYNGDLSTHGVSHWRNVELF